MKRVKLGGRELRIEDNAVAAFLQKGYSVIDENGEVVQKGNVTTFKQAVEENNALRAEIALCQETIKALKAENASLKAAAKKKAEPKETK